MSHLFVGDGYPEAEEFASNYVWVDPEHPDGIGSASLRKNTPTRRTRLARRLCFGMTTVTPCPHGSSCWCRSHAAP